MSEPKQIEEDENVELVPVPMSPETIAALVNFARKVGEPPMIAAAMLLADLLEDEDFLDAVDDPNGVEPQILN